MLEIKIVEDSYSSNKLPGVVIHETELLESEAKLAIDLMTRWGMVACTIEEEDSSGRAMMRLLSPEEVVTRAFDCAKLAFAEARLRGLSQDIGKIYDDKEVKE